MIIKAEALNLYCLKFSILSIGGLKKKSLSLLLFLTSLHDLINQKTQISCLIDEVNQFFEQVSELH